MLGKPEAMIFEFICAQIKEDFEADIRILQGTTEDQTERILELAMIALVDYTERYIFKALHSRGEDEDWESYMQFFPDHWQILLEPQVAVGVDTVSFLVTALKMSTSQKFQIIVDVRDEKEPERERRLIKHGMRVISFIKSEIVDYPVSCGLRVITLAEDMAKRNDTAKFIKDDGGEPLN